MEGSKVYVLYQRRNESGNNFSRFPETFILAVLRVTRVNWCKLSLGSRSSELAVFGLSWQLSC